MEIQFHRVLIAVGISQPEGARGLTFKDDLFWLKNLCSFVLFTSELAQIWLGTWKFPVDINTYLLV